MSITELELLHGHTSEDTALVVDDYPYGRRVRTKIRYWIETTKHGDRMCSQTLHPTGGYWNKPKKSTYNPVGFLFRQAETGHVKWTALHIWPGKEKLAEWQPIIAEHGNDGQKRQYAILCGYEKAFENVTWEIRPGRQTDEERAEQERINGQIHRAVNVYAHQALSELNS